MKHFKYLISLLSLTTLVGCSNSQNIIENSISSSSDSAISQDVSSNNNTSATVFNELETICFGDLAYQQTSGITYSFKLFEFGESVFETKNAPGYFGTVELYFNGQRIIEQMDYYIGYASDINNDGYREIITTYDDSLLIVYDVHNNCELFKKDLNKEEVPSLNNGSTSYAYDVSMNADKTLRLTIWNGSKSNAYFDYAYFKYNSSKNSLEFELQNMYDIEDFSFLSMYQGEEQVFADKNNVYHIQKGVQYIITFQIIRKEDADLSKVMASFGYTSEQLNGGVQARINGEYLDQMEMNYFCENNNGFGKYRAKFCLDNDKDYANQGVVTVKRVNLGFAFNYQIVK